KPEPARNADSTQRRRERRGSAEKTAREQEKGQDSRLPVACGERGEHGGKTSKLRSDAQGGSIMPLAAMVDWWAASGTLHAWDYSLRRKLSDTSHWLSGSRLFFRKAISV